MSCAKPSAATIAATIVAAAIRRSAERGHVVAIAGRVVREGAPTNFDRELAMEIERKLLAKSHGSRPNAREETEYYGSTLVDLDLRSWQVAFSPPEVVS